MSFRGLESKARRLCDPYLGFSRPGFQGLGFIQGLRLGVK